MHHQHIPIDLSLLQNIAKESNTDVSIDQLTALVKALFHPEMRKNNQPHFSARFAYKATLALLEFLQQRHQPTMIEIGVIPAEQSSSTASSDTAADTAIVRIVTNDMPFVVDSVMEKLAEMGYQPIQMLHSVIGAKRDPHGKLLALGVSQTQHHAPYHSETVMSVQIQGNIAPHDLTLLKTTLKDVLASVQLVVQDWPTMQKAIAAVHAAIDNTHFSSPSKRRKEIQAFIRWLEQEHFTYLGTCEAALGATKIQHPYGLLTGASKKLIAEVLASQKTLSEHPTLTTDHAAVSISKLDYLSPVHRSVNLDCITFAIATEESTSFITLIGLFTTRLPYQSIRDIPLIRLTIQEVIEQSGLKHISHSRKELISLLEDFPRDALLTMQVPTLLSICGQLLTLLERPELRYFHYVDQDKRFIHSITTIPLKQFSRQITHRIEDCLSNKYDGIVDRVTTHLGHPHLARLHILIKRHSQKALPDANAIEQALKLLAEDWYDRFKEALLSYYNPEQTRELFGQYVNAFPEHFREAFPPDMVAKHDIDALERASSQQQLISTIYPMPGTNQLHLKLCSPAPITLSQIMPTLDCMGFITIESTSYQCSPARGNVWVYHFILTASCMTAEGVMHNRTLIIEAFDEIWQRGGENDAFNQLVICAGLTARQVNILRAYARYLHQVGSIYSDKYVAEVLTRHAPITALLIALFEAMHRDNNATAIEKTKTALQKELTLVTNSADDHLLTEFMKVIGATVRTNLFQKDASGATKPYLAFKLQSSLVPHIPKPVPYAEIFVYSKDMEGIHLRGGKVARGGIRWSDRPEDFRTEILGLMKAQTTKNAVIVPVGAKGGFIIKNPTTEGREAAVKQAIDCYSTLLRGMLDITDNLMAGQVVHPPQVICHDDPDPYLVVAADKGTATFSDTANQIASDYHFWLGDAFASGGSAGYDHKKMGITARGAWVSIERHFYELGLSIHQTPFSVVGVGDMSGDVFGNGMLYSKQIKLVAAFNHQHIFFDPSPDPAISFVERQRLFALPRSSWTDYNPTLISAGGGVFERSAKLITLTGPMCQAIGLEPQEMQLSPEALIRAILSAPVDLLFNGGIGTYVRARDEANELVGDKTNDALRIPATELRCRVVGEGGNLGFTQRGRIEFANRGGKINTDAIDNSAGVDCSDHEVNIKIALTGAVERGELKESDRNNLLAEMTDAVAYLVLRDNQLQTLAISLEHAERHSLLALHHRLIIELEQDGLLDRQLEYLPDTVEIERRMASDAGLTRPEIAIVLAYSKMSIYSKILASTLPDEPYFIVDLLRYFPKEMRISMEHSIVAHPLRREIIATFITNSMVNRVGPTFCQLALDDSGLTHSDLARAYTICRDTFELRDIWDTLQSAMHQIPATVQHRLFYDIKHLAHKCTLWLMRNTPASTPISILVEEFREGVIEARKHRNLMLIGNAKIHYEKRVQEYLELGMPLELAERVSTMMALSSSYDIVQVANRTASSIIKVGTIYYGIETRCHFDMLRSEINKLSLDHYWQRLAVSAIKEELYDLHRQLTTQIIENHLHAHDPIASWEKDHQKTLQRFDHFIVDLKALPVIEFPMLIVAIKRIHALFA